MGNVIHDDFDLGPVTDASGNAVETDDVISRALAPEKIDFEFDGLKYSVVICKTQVPGRLTNRVQAITSKLALRAGFTAGEEFAPDDERAGRFMELLAENEVLEAANADIAFAATVVRDEKPRTNVPFSEKFSREAILGLGALGEAYTSAILEHLRPTLAEATPAAGAVEAPTTKKAKATASLAS